MITNCRGCGSPDLHEVIDLGVQHLSDFRIDYERPPAYPLRLLRCGGCTLAQLDTTVPRDAMYHDGYGYISGVNEGIRRNLAAVVAHARSQHPTARSWLDIACNDGTLLSNLPDTMWRAGCDPVVKLADRARDHADLIVGDYFHPDRFDGHQFDVITAVSMFYDLDNPGGFLADVAKLLASNGILVIQQNYLLSMLDNTSYDNICHEHITYFTLTALDYLLHQHGLETIDVEFDPVNGGCIRTVIAHKGTHPVRPTVAAARHIEQQTLDSPQLYTEFANWVRYSITELSDLVERINARGQSCYIYAASTRGATIWQACKLGPDQIGAAVERQPEKVGRQYSAIGVPIISEEHARAERPDYMLVGPWWHRDQFVQREADYLRAGGNLIFPLPVLHIVDRTGRPSSSAAA